MNNVQTPLYDSLNRNFMKRLLLADLEKDTSYEFCNVMPAWTVYLFYGDARLRNIERFDDASAHTPVTQGVAVKERKA